MKYIQTFHESDNINDIYLVKQRTSAVTKNGKAYDNVILQDKTGTIDGKIWDPNSAGIDDFEAMDYVAITGTVKEFNSALQLSITRARKARAGEYSEEDYLPVSGNSVDGMYNELLSYINGLENTWLKQLCEEFFVKDEEFIKKFKVSSAAKSVHHSFVGGLLEHTLSVTRLCEYYTKAYPMLKKDLLISVAILHDIGKVRELSAFPENDYTDDGQLLGHIVMGSEMVSEKIKEIDGFPVKLASEIKHCILAHHGEYEFGSPKKPALMEAVALNFADNTDAKLETLTEIFRSTTNNGWLGFNRLLDSNLRKTGELS
ncbi:MAG: HD domain-containing protein [Lachnospiraceae bacterium]|nr:HD domain-containing protein [Lachnospiraceae bacterium]